MVLSVIGVVVLLLVAGWMLRLLVSVIRRDGLREVTAVIGEALLLTSDGAQSGRRR